MAPVPHSKGSRGFLSALNVRRRSGVSSRPQTSDGCHPEEKPRGLFHRSHTRRAASIDTSTSAPDLHTSKRDFQDVQSSEASDVRGVPTLKPKSSFINKSWLGRRDRSKPKSPLGLEISAPFNPQKQDHEQIWQPMDPKPMPTTTESLPMEQRLPVPRSASAFSFGSLFKFGSSRGRDAGDSTNIETPTKRNRSADPFLNGQRTGVLDPRYEAARNVDYIPKNNCVESVSDSEAFRRRRTQDDPEFLRTIGLSPKLQQVLGEHGFDPSGSLHNPGSVFSGSPVPKREQRQSMAHYRRNDEDLDCDEEEIMGAAARIHCRAPFTRRTMYSTSSLQQQSSAHLAEPTYHWGKSVHSDLEVVKPEEIAEPVVTPSMLRVLNFEQRSAMIDDNEEISGLKQHPNVEECVQPPTWYRDQRSRENCISSASQSISDIPNVRQNKNYYDKRLTRYPVPGNITTSCNVQLPPVPRIPNHHLALHQSSVPQLPALQLPNSPIRVTNDRMARLPRVPSKPAVSPTISSQASSVSSYHRRTGSKKYVAEADLSGRQRHRKKYNRIHKTRGNVSRYDSLSKRKTNARAPQNNYCAESSETQNFVGTYDRQVQALVEATTQHAEGSENMGRIFRRIKVHEGIELFPISGFSEEATLKGKSHSCEDNGNEEGQANEEITVTESHKEEHDVKHVEEDIKDSVLTHKDIRYGYQPRVAPKTRKVKSMPPPCNYYEDQCAPCPNHNETWPGKYAYVDNSEVAFRRPAGVMPPRVSPRPPLNSPADPHVGTDLGCSQCLGGVDEPWGLAQVGKTDGDEKGKDREYFMQDICHEDTEMEGGKGSNIGRQYDAEYEGKWGIGETEIGIATPMHIQQPISSKAILIQK